MINITETQLRQIIKEETEQFLDEVDWAALGQKAKGLGKSAIKGVGDLAVGTAKVAGKVGKHLGTGVGDAVGGAIGGIGKGIRKAMGPSKQQQQAQLQQAQQQGQQLIQRLSTVQWTPDLIAAVTQAVGQPTLHESINRANVKKLASECKKNGKVKIVKKRVAPIIVEV
tara:strand:+ start:1297 stop:1803 length:507 start_codon:yes stop_codon:yes gene_type:complete